MEEKSSYKPLDGWPLFNDAWVFFFYGWGVAALMNIYDSKGASLVDLDKLLFEPYSVGAFFIISTFGFILVLGSALFLEHRKKLTGNKLREVFILKRVFIPISEVGLSAGSIIIGMSLGVAWKFSGLVPLNEQHSFTKIGLAIALLVSFIYWPMFWQQRSILAVGKIENLKFNILGLAYIGICGFLLYIADVEKFWWVSGISTVIISIAYFVMIYRSRS